MKNFFSAILLIAAMAFSVSTFVSCNDLVQEVEDVTAQAGANAEAIKALQAQLESGLASANAAVEAAKTAAEKAVAEAKKAAIEEALAQAKELDAENTEAINALKAVVDALNGKITTLEGADAALKLQLEALVNYLKFDGEKSEVVADLVAQIEALQAKIEDASVLDDIKKEFEAIKKELADKIAELDILGDVEALIKMIQSVSYVPTDSEGITNVGIVRLTGWANNMYDVKGDDNIKYVLATYEVYPKEALETLTNENLQFLTVKTKVAEASNFAAKIIEKDKDTGRMLVLGIIKKDDTNRAIFRNPENFSIALVVSDKDYEYGKPGNNVSSDYAKIQAGAEVFEITDHLGWVNANGVFGPYERVVKVPFDKADDSKRVLFNKSEKDIMVNFDGTLLTQAQVKDIFGIEMTIKYDSKPVQKDFTPKTGGFKYETDEDGNLVDSSIVYDDTKKYFEAEAEMKAPKNKRPEGETDDFQWLDAIGDELTAVIPEFTVNGAVVENLTATSTYRITHTGGEINITSPVEIPWNYKYAPEWTTRYDQTSAENANNNNFLATMTELTVDAPAGVDFTALKSDDVAEGGNITPAGYIQLTGTATYIDGTPYEEGKTFNVWVKAMGTSIARLAGSSSDHAAGVYGLKFAEEDLYWEFSGTAFDGAGKAYEITMEPFVTKAVPQYKGATIKETVNVVGYRNTTVAMEGSTDIIGKMIGAMKIFNTETDNLKDEVYAAFAKTGAIVISESSVSGVGKDEKTIPNLKVDKLAISPSYQAKTADKDFDETSVLKVDKAVYGDATRKLNYGDVLTWKFKATVFGVTYPFEYTINITEPRYSVLEYNDGYTTDGKVALQYAGSAAAGYSIPALNLKNFYKTESQSAALKNLIAGKTASDKTATFAGEYEVAYEMAYSAKQYFLANKDIMAEEEEDKVEAEDRSPALWLPIATIDDGTISWVGQDAQSYWNGLETLTGLTGTDLANVLDQSTGDGWEPRAKELKFNNEEFTFNIVVRTKNAVKWDAATKKYVQAVVDSKSVTFTLPEYVEFTADTYKGNYVDEPNKPATGKATQKALVIAKGTNATNQVLSVANSLLIDNIYDKTNKEIFAQRYISSVSIVKKFYADKSGEYVWTGSGDVDPYTTSGYELAVDQAAGEVTAETPRYSFKYVPVFNAEKTESPYYSSIDAAVYGYRTFKSNFLKDAANKNGIEIQPFDWKKNMVTTNYGQVRLIDSSNEGVYQHPDYKSTMPATAIEADKKANEDLKYTAPAFEDCIVEYDVATGLLKLNNQALQAGVKMADLKVEVPVTLDWNFKAGTETVTVTIYFTEEANEAGTAPKATFWDGTWGL